MNVCSKSRQNFGVLMQHRAFFYLALRAICLCRRSFAAAVPIVSRFSDAFVLAKHWPSKEPRHPIYRIAQVPEVAPVSKGKCVRADARKGLLPLEGTS